MKQHMLARLGQQSMIPAILVTGLVLTILLVL